MRVLGCTFSHVPMAAIDMTDVSWLWSLVAPAAQAIRVAVNDETTHALG